MKTWVYIIMNMFTQDNTTYPMLISIVVLKKDTI